MDSLPGSFVHGIFQARVLEWAAITFGSVQSSERSVMNMTREDNAPACRAGAETVLRAGRK